MLKTPQQNAAAMFKEYGKMKAAKEHLTVLVAEGETQLDYLNSVLNELQCAESEKDVADIRRELIATGYDRKAKAVKKERLRPQLPLRFVTDDGLEVLVGRSNIQNDELTTKLARRTDYWLHTQKVHGSHVILRCDGRRAAGAQRRAGGVHRGVLFAGARLRQDAGGLYDAAFCEEAVRCAAGKGDLYRLQDNHHRGRR
ncbi:MAG: NFACT RNA binding domain-containing protein [Oscillospiraceae bacterium]